MEFKIDQKEGLQAPTNAQVQTLNSVMGRNLILSATDINKTILIDGEKNDGAFVMVTFKDQACGMVPAAVRLFSADGKVKETEGKIKVLCDVRNEDGRYESITFEESSLRVIDQTPNDKNRLIAGALFEDGAGQVFRSRNTRELEALRGRFFGSTIPGENAGGSTNEVLNDLTDIIERIWREKSLSVKHDIKERTIESGYIDESWTITKNGKFLARYTLNRWYDETDGMWHNLSIEIGNDNGINSVLNLEYMHGSPYWYLSDIQYPFDLRRRLKESR